MNPGATHTDDQRPTLVLLVYCWDLLLALLALFGALAALGGGVAVGGGSKAVPLGVQIAGALSSAAYAAVLATVASLLTRRRRWIQRIQIVVLALAVALGVISLVVDAFRGGGIPTAQLLVVLLFLLLDAAAIMVMTERRIVRWYVEPGAAPRWVLGVIAFWVVTALLVVAVEAAV